MFFVDVETILALNRNPDYCVYAAGQSKSTSSPEAAENKFNELCLQERSKIQQETLMNVGGRSGGASLKGGKGMLSMADNRALQAHLHVNISNISYRKNFGAQYYAF